MSGSTFKAGRSLVPGVDDEEEEEEDEDDLFVDEEDNCDSDPQRWKASRAGAFSSRTWRWKLGCCCCLVGVIVVSIAGVHFSTSHTTETMTVEFHVETELTVLEQGDSCSTAILSLHPTDYHVEEESARFVLVRRIANWPDAMERLELLLNREPRLENLQRYWIVDNLLQRDTLQRVLDDRGESYTLAQQRLREFWEAPLVFDNDDSLHQADSFLNISELKLQEDIFNSVYQNKLQVLQRTDNSQPDDWKDILTEIWTNETDAASPSQPVHLIQWGAFCLVTNDSLEVWQRLANETAGTHEESISTTPQSSTTTTSHLEIDDLDQDFVFGIERQALVSIGGFQPDRLIFYNQEQMERERDAYQQEIMTRPTTNESSSLVTMIEHLLASANNASNMGPWSVMDKPNCDLLPSCHYYYSRSPYYWPSPDSPNGVEKRDGYRVPGTQTHDSESYKYDRTRWYDLYQNTTVVALAWFYSGNATYAEIGARNIRVWFLDPETRMEPTLTYAHVELWDNLPDDYAGIPYGIIDLIDLYFFMDTIRLICESGQFTEQEQKDLRLWFRKLLDYVKYTKTGERTWFSGNNIGTYHDLLTMSVASFVGDLDSIVTSASWTASRLWEQVDPSSGALPHELARPTCMHYQIYCLQGWTNLARVSRGIGYNLWPAQRNGVEPLCQAIEYVLSRNASCPGNIKEEDTRQLWPLWMQAKPHCPAITDPTLGNVTTPYDLPTDLLSHWWNFGI